ncbi:MAG: histidine phosphatase family protein, partial [Pseudomonadales bacterium]
ILTSTAFVFAIQMPAVSQADSEEYEDSNRVVIYFTRHAEKKTELQDFEDGTFMEICGESKCSEVLNAKGELRAELLADWFSRRDITERLTHAFSSHKQRTLQTIELIAAEAGLNDDDDLILDGVQQLPHDGTELAPESTTPSEAPTIEALQNLPGGSVAVVAGHSGTLYDIMEGLGLDTADEEDYPRNADGKVRDFGDIWKVVLKDNGEARLKYRKNLQPVRLRVVD